MQTFSEFSELMTIKRYAPNTVNAYRGLLLAFQKFVQIDVDTLTNSQINEYIAQVVTQKQLAINTQKQLIGAIKLYFKEIHSISLDCTSVYPRAKPKTLPVVLSLEEVQAILGSCTNSKHKAMLTLVYALGLRSGELINLKIEHINKHRKQVHITAAKNNKDRILPFPNKLKDVLTPYYLEYRPQEYLFNGQGSPQYSAQSLRKVFNTACKKAGVHKKVTLHSLRHAYATHLMEAGTDVRVIKELLGHNDIKTTLIYTHVSQRNLDNIPSPIDFFK